MEKPDRSYFASIFAPFEDNGICFASLSGTIQLFHFFLIHFASNFCSMEKPDRSYFASFRFDLCCFASLSGTNRLFHFFLIHFASIFCSMEKLDRSYFASICAPFEDNRICFASVSLVWAGQSDYFTSFWFILLPIFVQWKNQTEVISLLFTSICAPFEDNGICFSSVSLVLAGQTDYFTSF
jgi:hypothetical protein